MTTGTPDTPAPLIQELEFALEIAREAGTLTLQWFPGAGRNIDVDRKDDGSPVTRADRAAEALLRRRIAERYPGDAILGEEEGESTGDTGRRWILDPIDGTRSFIRGVPLYGVLVALEVHGAPRVGVIHMPALGDTVAAARGAGCTWNGRPARVSDTSRLEDALVLTSGDPAPSQERMAGWRRLADRAGTARTWGDCYGYALVATGRAEAMLDPILNTWDAAAVRPIIEEAGGVFTDWYGGDSHDAGHAVATNAALTGPIREVLKP
ncbi:MAG TPA: inositol monophosphatase family protein [Longimicrobiales bacterium]|nr:inositol monophosphatase family protein [Longimicrobiales bacterium]